MTDDDFGTALHDRVRDEHPDLDQLIRVSTRAGTRLRRRRTPASRSPARRPQRAAVAIVGASLGGSGRHGWRRARRAAQPGARRRSARTPSDVVSVAAPARRDLTGAGRAEAARVGV